MCELDEQTQQGYQEDDVFNDQILLAEAKIVDQQTVLGNANQNQADNASLIYRSKSSKQMLTSMHDSTKIKAIVKFQICKPHALVQQRHTVQWDLTEEITKSLEAFKANSWG